MSEQELAEIEARAKAATPGPWKLSNGTLYYDPDSGCQYTEELFSTFEGHSYLLDTLVTRKGADIKWNRNHEFIAHAREDIPALIAEIRRLRNESDAMKMVIANAEHVSDRQERTRPEAWQWLKESIANLHSFTDDLQPLE